MSKVSILPYICNPEQIEKSKDLGQGFFSITKKGEQFGSVYVKLNNGGQDFYVRSRLPRDLFIKLQAAK